VDNHQKIVRILTCYNNFDGEVIDITHLQDFCLESFKEHFQIDGERDPKMHQAISLVPEDIPFVSAYLSGDPGINFDLYSYCIEAVIDDIS